MTCPFTLGKGRTIAGIILENYCQKRKRAIWVSVSNDLKYDAERDLGDIGAGHIDVHFLSKMKYVRLCFCAYLSPAYCLLTVQTAHKVTGCNVKSLIK